MAELKKTTVKSKVEAVMFSTGRRISLDEVSRLCRSRKEDVLLSLQELKKEYDEKQSSLMLVEEGDFWKFTVRDHLISIVRKIVTETELSKTVLETLAVIAFKYPILQSDLIKMRTNKAYDHLAELEASGYISRQKHSRTNLIKLTDKFFRYFDLTEESLKDKFRDFDSISKAIREKEEEIVKIKDDQRKKAEELKKEDEKIKKEIDELDKSGEEFEVPLETYESKQKEVYSQSLQKEGELQAESKKVGGLEVVDEEKPQGKKAQINEIEQIEAEGEVEAADKSPAAEVPEMSSLPKEEKINEKGQPSKPRKPRPKKKKGIEIPPEMEAIVDKKVEQILHPETEKKEEGG